MKQGNSQRGEVREDTKLIRENSIMSSRLNWESIEPAEDILTFRPMTRHL